MAGFISPLFSHLHVNQERAAPLEKNKYLQGVLSWFLSDAA